MSDINVSRFSYGRGYVYSLQYHVVWCVKYRRNVLQGGIEASLKQILQSTAGTLGIVILAMETMPDHIHLLIDCSPQHYIPDLIKVLKGNSARRLFLDFPELKTQLWGGHMWNPSYFVATVSDNTEAQILQYINSQQVR